MIYIPVPTLFGMMLIPSTSITLAVVTQAKGRDGVTQAKGRDGVTQAVGRDGLALGKGH